ncbi:MAG: RNA 2',3'-cyclic phosphodiesterase [Armatimonadetes bacterium]|nr:RNA 2',3'-cyclic phosphodiesterase [Armatimonadota bacterium]
MVTLHRTFIAVELDPELQRAVAEVQERLRAAGARLRWVKPHNVHFTLRFLGEIPAAQVARATVASREAAKDVVPFAITLAGFGAFPGPNRPQVVWIGLRDGAEPLERLGAHLDAALARQGFAPDPRQFRPHATLGRPRDDRRWGDLVRVLEQYRNLEIGRQEVTRIAVMESRLTPDGPVYTVCEQVPLDQGLNASPE